MCTFLPKINPVSSPILIQGKPRKRRAHRKLYDKFGNELNQQDGDIMNDIAQGRKVLYYKENILTKTNSDVEKK